MLKNKKVECNQCEEIVHIIDYDEKFGMCNECVSSYIAVCDGCGEEIHIDETDMIKNNCYCTNCIEKLGGSNE